MDVTETLDLKDAALRFAEDAAAMNRIEDLFNNGIDMIVLRDDGDPRKSLDEAWERWREGRDGQGVMDDIAAETDRKNEQARKAAEEQRDRTQDERVAPEVGSEPTGDADPRNAEEEIADAVISLRSDVPNDTKAQALPEDVPTILTPDEEQTAQLGDFDPDNDRRGEAWEAQRTHERERWSSHFANEKAMHKSIDARMAAAEELYNLRQQIGAAAWDNALADVQTAFGSKDAKWQKDRRNDERVARIEEIMDKHPDAQPWNERQRMAERRVAEMAVHVHVLSERDRLTRTIGDERAALKGQEYEAPASRGFEDVRVTSRSGWWVSAGYSLNVTDRDDRHAFDVNARTNTIHNIKTAEAYDLGLRLAQKAWGGAVLTGTEAQKQYGIERAVAIGVEVRNPELREQYNEAMRAHLREQMERNVLAPEAQRAREMMERAQRGESVLPKTPPSVALEAERAAAQSVDAKTEPTAAQKPEPAQRAEPKTEEPKRPNRPTYSKDEIRERVQLEFSYKAAGPNEAVAGRILRAYNVADSDRTTLVIQTDGGKRLVGVNRDLADGLREGQTVALTAERNGSRELDTEAAADLVRQRERQQARSLADGFEQGV